MSRSVSMKRGTSGNIWIDGCADWMWEHSQNGWGVYYLNFMFRPFSGGSDAVVAQEKRAIAEGFYPRFCTKFSRQPNRPAQQERLPRFMLFPDLHVWKHANKASIREVQFNDNGLHFNGPMLIPPVSRFQENVVQHIQDNQRKYAVQGIERIDAKLADWDLDNLADYAGKTIKWNRASPDDILMLPGSPRTPPAKNFSAEEKEIRAVQARHNVSEEIARLMLLKKKGTH